MLTIDVGDVVLVSRGALISSYAATVLAFNERMACVSAAAGAWDTINRDNIVQVIKRTNLPQLPRLFRVTAEVIYLVKSNSAEEAADLVQERPDLRIDYVLVEPEDAKPIS